ncbi:sensor histidine kinase [Leptospira sp. WS92.C1]
MMEKNRALLFLVSDYRGILISNGLFCTLLGSAFYGLLFHSSETDSRIRLSLILGFLFIQYLVLFFICRHLLIEKYGSEGNPETKNPAKFPVEKKVFLGAQIYNLRMTPHFLFNSLMTLRIYMESARSDAVEYLDSLANMLRYSFRFVDRDKVSLKEELDFMLSYFDLIKNKANHPFRIILKKDESVDIDKISIPPFLIQTLVENSIKYGVMTSDKPVLIEVEITNDDSDRVKIVVKDDGPGTTVSKNFSEGTFFYLKRRLNEICIDVDFRIQSDLGKGFRTEISFCNPALVSGRKTDSI